MIYQSKEYYRKDWDAAFTFDPSVPLNLDIELAALCNLACPSCSWGESEFAASMTALDWDGLPKKRIMPTDMAIRLIDEAAAIGIPAVKLNYKGESTLHRDFAKIAKHAHDTGAFHEILLNTNGNCGQKAWDGFQYFTRVMVSLDTLRPDLYDKIRFGGNIERALDTIWYLKQNKHPDFWVRRVIGVLNKDEPFVENVHRMFGPGIRVSEHYAFDRNKDTKVSVHEGDIGQWERQYCGYPSQRLIVTAAGVILPCCIMWGDEYPIGRWPELSLIQAWQSDTLKDLRKTLRANDIKNAPDICKNCTSFMAYKRPERAYVQDVDGKAKLSEVKQ